MDWTALLTVLGAIAGGGGTAGVIAARRPRPGTPEDQERRLDELERAHEQHEEHLSAQDERLDRLEGRMQNTETALAGAIGRLTEAFEGQRRSTDRLADSVDELRGLVAKLDVEATIEREMRKHRRAATKPEKE